MMISIDSLIGLLAPNSCIGCGVEGSVLCDSCLSVAGEPIAPRCAGCRKLSKDWKTCNSCKSWLKASSVIVSAPYDGVYEQLIHAYKYDMKRQAASALAALLSTTIPRDTIEEYIVTCIPTAPARIRARGFDNGKLFARELASRLSLPFSAVLYRHSNVRQVGASRSQRIRQMEHEFYILKPEKITGHSFLLVDDVMTTGASIAAASQALKAAGAKQVSVAVFAQKV